MHENIIGKEKKNNLRGNQLDLMFGILEFRGLWHYQSWKIK